MPSPTDAGAASPNWWARALGAVLTPVGLVAAAVGGAVILYTPSSASSRDHPENEWLRQREAMRQRAQAAITAAQTAGGLSRTTQPIAVTLADPAPVSTPRDVDRSRCAPWDVNAARQYVRESHRTQLRANWEAFRFSRRRAFDRVDSTVFAFMRALSQTQAAEVAIVSHAGCRLAVGRGYKHIRDSVHAEMQAVRGLWAQYEASVAALPRPLTKGARLLVITNDPTCSRCAPRLAGAAAAAVPRVSFRPDEQHTSTEDRVDLEDAPARMVADWFRSLPAR